MAKKKLTGTQKVLILGGVGVVGYFLWQHFEGAGQISTLAASTTPVIATNAGTTVSIPSTGSLPASGTPTDAVVTPVIPITAQGNLAAPSALPSSTPVNQTELAALLQWAKSTKSPALYTQMINLLDASQVDNLYSILETQWLTGAPATPTHTAFWNGLRQLYPFLNTGGVGCNNLQCT